MDEKPLIRFILHQNHWTAVAHVSHFGGAGSSPKIPIGHHRHEPASLLSPMQLVQDLKLHGRMNPRSIRGVTIIEVIALQIVDMVVSIHIINIHKWGYPKMGGL